MIYDKFHRFEETEKVKHQQNTAQNIYDMFDFIITHYENLPECTLFCRACSMWPKDTGTPRLDENGDRLSITVIQVGWALMVVFLRLIIVGLLIMVQESITITQTHSFRICM